MASSPEYQADYYIRNAETIRARAKERYSDGGRERSRLKQREKRAWLRSLKDGRACEDCGQHFPTYVLDWHHLDPSDKAFEISGDGTSKGRATILAEIEKCALLCSNCHRIREYEGR